MLVSLVGGKVRDRIKLASARWIFRRYLPWSNEPRMAFVAATRLSEQEFWTDSALGRSLQRFRSDPKVDIHLFFGNALGLPTVYNQALVSSNLVDIVVFLHDDVWLAEEDLYGKLKAALARFDVVGVAGNVRRIAYQPSWAFSGAREGKIIWDHEYLSGAIRHGSVDRHVNTSFGPSPARCELLDGVFLACRRRELIRRNVRFDDRFEFHFYDLDLCRSARLAGLKLGTWPIELIHQSVGAFGSEESMKAYASYLEKWGQ